MSLETTGHRSSVQSVPFLVVISLIIVLILFLDHADSQGKNKVLEDNQCDNYRTRFPQTKAEIAKTYSVKEDNVTIYYEPCATESPVVRRFLISTEEPTVFTRKKDTWIVIGDWDSPDHVTILGSDAMVIAQRIEVRFQENISTGGDVSVQTGPNP